jgi:hypothetical protein
MARSVDGWVFFEQRPRQGRKISNFSGSENLVVDRIGAGRKLYCWWGGYQMPTKSIFQRQPGATHMSPRPD